MRFFPYKIVMLNDEAPWLLPQIPPSKDTQDNEYLFQPLSTVNGSVEIILDINRIQDSI